MKYERRRLKLIVPCNNILIGLYVWLKYIYLFVCYLLIVIHPFVFICVLIIYYGLFWLVCDLCHCRVFPLYVPHASYFFPPSSYRMLGNYTNENLVYFSTFHTHNIFRAHFLQKSFRSGVHFYSMPCSCLGWLVCGMESNIKKRSQLYYVCSFHFDSGEEKSFPFRFPISHTIHFCWLQQKNLCSSYIHVFLCHSGHSERKKVFCSYYPGISFIGYGVADFFNKSVKNKIICYWEKEEHFPYVPFHEQVENKETTNF